MLEPESKPKLSDEKSIVDKFEELNGKKLCSFCDIYVKNGYCCLTLDDAKKCYRKKDDFKVYKTECDYCSMKFDDPKKLGAHKISCKLNPKRYERNIKIAEAKLGKKRDKDTIDKINKIKERNKIEQQKIEEIQRHKIELKLDDGKNIFIKFKDIDNNGK